MSSYSVVSQSETKLGPSQPPTEWMPGVFLGEKLLKCEVNYSFPSS
jgi:hypothetical protein